MNTHFKIGYAKLTMTALFILSVMSVFPETYAQEESKAGLFDSDEVLEIVLTTDIKSLIKTKDIGEYQAGEINIGGETYPVRLKARGNYRKENCSLPPVTLNFTDTEFKDKSYEQLGKVKLVNVCKMQSTYEQYILEEYLIYRTFNLLTDKSFKVRLLKINYVDSKEKINTVTRYGFVIEDQYMLADRLGAIIIKKEGIRDEDTNLQQMVMLSIFQFMIGNTDWSVPRLQNLKLAKINVFTEPTPYVIPYDFDYTGMVNASYAIPSPILGIETIRERLYWGKCFSQEQLSEAVDYFIQKKESIYSLYNDFTLLDKRSRNQSLAYLDSFYKIIENEKEWKSYFIDKCRK